MNVYDFDGTIFPGDCSIGFCFWCMKRHPKMYFTFFPKMMKNLFLRKIGKMPEYLVQRKFFGYLTMVDDFEEQIEVVNRTLEEIHAQDKPIILVFNKIDAFTYTPKEPDDLTPMTRENLSLEDLKRTWMSRMNQDNCIFVSATEKANMEAFKQLIYDKVREIHVTRFHYNDFLFQKYDSLGEEQNID